MSTSAAVWSIQLANGTSGVASALVSIMTALFAFRGADTRAEDRAQMLGALDVVEQAATRLERCHDKYDEIDFSGLAESPRADLCAAREGLVSAFASLDDVLLPAAADLRHLIEATRPDVLPPEIANRLLSATSRLVRAVERLAVWRGAIAGIEHEIDSQDVAVLLARPPQPVPWDQASRAFGLT